MCVQLRCRVWIEWVPSKSNPADILSRQHVSDKDLLKSLGRGDRKYREMELPDWANQGLYDTLDKIIQSLDETCALKHKV